MGYTTGSNNGFVTRYERRIANFVCFFLLFLFFFFSIIYVNSSEKKPSFYPNIHIYYICRRVSTKQKAKTNSSEFVWRKRIVTCIIRLFFFLPPSPFFFWSLFSSVTIRNTACLLFSFGWCIETAHLDERLETTNGKLYACVQSYDMKRKEKK